MLSPLLRSQLEPVAHRYRRLQLWRGLTVCWGLSALVGVGLISIYHLTGWWSSLALPVLAVATFVCAVVIWRKTRVLEPDFRWVARQIEQQNPELRALLLTAVEQMPKEGAEPLSYLEQRVIKEALSHTSRRQWADTVAGSQLVFAQAVHLVTLALLVLTMTGMRFSQKQSVVMKRLQAGITVTPGDTSIERGNPLVVLARFAGPLPASVEMVIGTSPESSKVTPLVKSLDDPVFGGSVSEVTEDFTYRVEYGKQRTRDFKVKVFEHPRLEKSDVGLTFPEFTGQAPKRIEDTRRVSAVEGTKLDLALQLNKPVVSAKLVARDKTSVTLTTETNKATATLNGFDLKASKSYELQLVDADGRTNKMSTQFVFDVLKNRAPELKFAKPRGDQRVSALEEINFQAEAWDDFGLKAYGIAYMIPGKGTKYIELGKDAPAKEKRQFGYLLRLEELGMQPDEMVAYFVWADDMGPDGKERRTSSDMYFAEVRPFDEIYRQGQPQEGEGGQQQQQKGNPATKLADLQKQIISATWRLQRDEAGATKPTPFQ